MGLVDFYHQLNHVARLAPALQALRQDHPAQRPNQLISLKTASSPMSTHSSAPRWQIRNHTTSSQLCLVPRFNLSNDFTVPGHPLRPLTLWLRSQLCADAQSLQHHRSPYACTPSMLSLRLHPVNALPTPAPRQCSPYVCTPSMLSLRLHPVNGRLSVTKPNREY